jgi:hypothetical protein
LGLRRLVAADQQDDDLLTALREVDAVPRPDVHPQFGDPFTDRLHVTEVAERQPPNADVDAHFGRAISQATKPLRVLGGLADFEHASLYPTKYKRAMDAPSRAVRQPARCAPCSPLNDPVALASVRARLQALAPNPKEEKISADGLLRRFSPGLARLNDAASPSACSRGETSTSRTLLISIRIPQTLGWSSTDRCNYELMSARIDSDVLTTLVGFSTPHRDSE